MNQCSLNVFFVVDKNFITHFTVTLTSLLENNKHLRVRVFVIHDIDHQEILEKVKHFFKLNYFLHIEFRMADKKLFENVPTSAVISKATYYKFLFADILPPDIESGVYMDCDIIVTGSLQKLVNPDFFDHKYNREYALLAVSDPYESKEMKRLQQTGIQLSGYLNAGVLVINLKKWREDSIAGKLIRITERYKDHIRWHDQDVFNIYFSNNWGKIPSTYNTFSCVAMETPPTIVHFGGLPKPWHYVSNDYYKPLYLKYLKMTPFHNEKFETLTFQKVLRKYWRKYRKRVRSRESGVGSSEFGVKGNHGVHEVGTENTE